MTCVVITAIGGDVAQGVASTIRSAFPDWYLVGADMGTRHGGALVVDRFVRAPGANDPEYLSWMAQLFHSVEATYCIPMSEAELVVLAARGLDPLEGVPFVTAGAKALHVGADKLVTAQFLEAIGLPAPWSLSGVESLMSRHFPCIYKPRSGSGSKVVFRCESFEEAVFLAQRHPGGLFQELLLPDDAEITCAVFRDRSGRVAVLQMLRQLVGGATGWAQVVEHPQITADCTAIAEALNLHGGLNVQLRLTKDGPRVFEINARFSSTVLMRHHMGFRDVAWTLEDLQGQTPDLFQPPVGMTAVRTHKTAMLAQSPTSTGDMP